MYINFLQDMFHSSQSMIFIVLGGFYTITANAVPTATLILVIFHTAKNLLSNTIISPFHHLTQKEQTKDGTLIAGNYLGHFNRSIKSAS